MAAPKITLQQLMLLMIVVALFLGVVSLALRGNTFALGVTVAVFGLSALMVFYQCVFAVIYWFAKAKAVVFSANHRRSKISEELE